MTRTATTRTTATTRPTAAAMVEAIAAAMLAVGTAEAEATSLY